MGTEPKNASFLMLKLGLKRIGLTVQTLLTA